MQFLEHFKIGESWIWSGILYALLIAGIVVTVLKWVSISEFLGEVKGELRKASWPWESDPKIKGLKKYKELVDSTIVVLIAMILLAGFVQFWDFFHVLIVGFFTNLGR
ncbi:MAG: preprotein translocase subunit SecE [Akkermansiaceae bacterium]|jgi:preprotein translocase subunit SecE|nr:preprotein translocase subunit SecE [Akkermansiaceae bacterium]